jgi:hypothetical protein
MYCIVKHLSYSLILYNDAEILSRNWRCDFFQFIKWRKEKDRNGYRCAILQPREATREWRYLFFLHLPLAFLDTKF